VIVYSTEWKKSSLSGAANNCVEHRVSFRDDGSKINEIRDSKNRIGPTLSFGSKQWAAFLDAIAPFPQP
jgi:hypothetical protein